MTSLRIRFATTNAPESFKKGLLRDKVARARKVSNWGTRRHIDVRAIQEAGTFAEQIDTETSLRKVLWAKVNNYVKGRRVGNGVDVNARRWKSTLLDDLTIGDLHIAVVLLTHRRTGFQFKFRAVHRPTRRAENSSLRDVIDDALEEQHRLDDKAGMPWVTAGDMNEGRWGKRGVELGRHSVDHIRASHHFEPLGQFVTDRPLLSDHCFLIADALVEI